MTRRPRRGRSAVADPARRLAFDALREVHANDGYANLVLARLLRERRLTARDAALATELLAGTCRLQGSYDAVIEAAAGRRTSTLQPAVLDLLRLGTHQLLSMRIADHAAVSATVDLASDTVGPRVTGLVNAVLRKVAGHSIEEWLDDLSRSLSDLDALALRTAHPRWIVDAFADLLPDTELEPALAADNDQPTVSLAVRPGLATVAELEQAGARPGRWSPYAAGWTGDPADLPAVAEGRAGVQDEGSQLAALALARATAPDGPWLDLCAGPGGKSALLAGLADQQQAGPAVLGAGAAPGPAGRLGAAWLPADRDPRGRRSRRHPAGLEAGRLRPGAGRRALHRARRPAPPAGIALAAAARRGDPAAPVAVWAADLGRTGAASRRRRRLRHLLPAPARDP